MEDRRSQVVKEINDLYQSGNYPLCLEQAMDALKLFDKDRDSADIYYGALLTVIGAALAETGDWSAAFIFFSQAETACQNGGDIRNLAVVHLNKGNVYKYANRWHEATGEYLQALSLFERVGDEASQMLVLSNMALFPPTADVLSEEMKSKIDEYAQRTDNLAAKSIALQAQGKIARSQDQEEAARIALQEGVRVARECEDKSILASALLELGWLKKGQKKWGGAIDCFKEGLSIAESEQFRDERKSFFLRYGLALCYTEQNDETHALSQFSKGIEWVEKARLNAIGLDKIQFALGYYHIYINYCLALLRFGRTREALEATELFQARPLLDLMFRHQIRRQGGRHIRVGVGGRVSLDAPRLDEMLSAARDLEMNVVKYVHLSDRLAIWLVSQSGQIFFDEKPFPHEEVKAVRACIPDTKWQPFGPDAQGAFSTVSGHGDSQEWLELSRDVQAASSRLFAKLFPSSISENLPPDGECLTIIPHRTLWEVPFGALVDNAGRYLVDRFAIGLVPSVGVLLQLDRLRNPTHDAESSPSPGSALVIGDPGRLEVEVDLRESRLPLDIKFADIKDPDPRIKWVIGFGELLPAEVGELEHLLAKGSQHFVLPALRGANEELDFVATKLSTTPIKSRSATKAAFLQRSSNKDIIHITTHGWWNALSGLDSFLLFAPEEPESDIGKKLTADEIINLQLDPLMVVLSACDTGLGSHTLDTSLSLPLGFLVAGASSVVASLWKVDDKATLELMKSFYGELLSGKSVVEALANAQRQIRCNDRWAHPYHWAGFVAIGERVPLNESQHMRETPSDPCFSGGDVIVMGGQEGQLLPLERFKTYVQRQRRAAIFRL